MDDAAFVLTDYCEGTSNSASGIVTPGGTFTFNPLPSGTETIDPASGEITDGVGGTTYTIQYVTSGTCPDSTTQTVTVDPLDDATFSYAAPAFCITDTDPDTTFTGTSGGTFTGSGSLVINNSTGTIDLVASGVGAYMVYYTTAGPCPDSDSVNITIDNSFDATITADTVYCENDAPLNLSATDAGGVWSGAGITNSNSGSFDPSAAGTGSNQIIYTIAGSCGDADTVQITVDPMPAATATAAEPIINLGEGTWLNGSGGTSYQWTPADGLGCATCLSTAANPQETTTYLLTVTDSNGCVSFDSVTVVIVQNPCGGEVFVPNVFTPNGDGENDKVYVFGKCIESMLFAIYDRWGNKIYESSDQSQGWDGTKQGKEFNNGVYVYMLNAVLQNEETVKLKGNITLLK